MIKNIYKYLENKNILTIDVWVAVALFALFPVPKADIITLSAILPSTAISFGFLGVLLVVIFLISCAHLRGFRYIDIYLECKKPASKLLKIAIIPLIISAIAFTLWVGITPYDIVVVSTTAALSLHLNNSKEKNKEVKGESKTTTQPYNPKSEKLYSLDTDSEVRIDSRGMVFITKK